MDEVNELMAKASLGPNPIHLSGPTSARTLLLSAVWSGQIDEVRSLTFSAALGRLDWEDALEMATHKRDSAMQTLVTTCLNQHPKIRAQITDWMSGY